MRRQVSQHDVHRQSTRNAGVDLLERTQNDRAGVSFPQISQDLVLDGMAVPDESESVRGIGGGGGWVCRQDGGSAGVQRLVLTTYDLHRWSRRAGYAICAALPQTTESCWGTGSKQRLISICAVR